jgi:hypothetical protein
LIKKYRSERKGRRNFDTALQYNPVDMMATEKARTRQPTGGPGCALTALRYNTVDMVATEKTRTAKSAVRTTR